MPVRLRFPNGVDRLDFVFQSPGETVKRTLRHLAGQGDNEGGLQREVGFVDDRLIGICRKLGLCLIHLVADIGQHFVLVRLDVEFEHRDCCRLGGDGGEFL